MRGKSCRRLVVTGGREFLVIIGWEVIGGPVNCWWRLRGSEIGTGVISAAKSSPSALILSVLPS